MTTPRAAVAAPPPAKERVKATLSRRQHVETITLIGILMIIESLVELRWYAALPLVALMTVGCRDILIVLLFAEEEGFIHE